MDKEINYCDSDYLTLAEITLNNEILDWFNQILMPLVENPNLLNMSIKGNIHDVFSGLNIMGGYGCRVTFRYFNAYIDFIDLNQELVKN